MSYETLLSQIVIMFIMVFVGVALGRKGAVSDKISKDLAIILLDIATPALIIQSMDREFNANLILQGGMSFLVCGITYMGAMLINGPVSKLLKIDEKHRGLWIFCASSTNPGFMGFPLAYAIFGTDGMFIAAIITVAFNIITYTYGTWLVLRDSPKKSELPSLAKTMISPINIATVIGLIFFFLRSSMEANLATAPEMIQGLVEIIRKVISNFTNLVSPLAMFLVGLSISRSSFKKVITDRDAVLAALFSMVVIPLCMLGVLKLFPAYEGSLVIPVSTLIMCMSIANACQMLSDRYGADSELAGHAIFLSTISCIVTVPLIMMLV